MNLNLLYDFCTFVARIWRHLTAHVIAEAVVANMITGATRQLRQVPCCYFHGVRTQSCFIVCTVKLSSIELNLISYFIICLSIRCAILLCTAKMGTLSLVLISPYIAAFGNSYIELIGTRCTHCHNANPLANV